MATAGATKVKGVDAAYYFVKDLDRATKFYTDLLGSPPTLVYDGFVAEWTFGGNETFGIFKAPEGEWHEGHGMLFAVDDIHSAVDDYKQRGIRFDEDPLIDESPGCFMASGYDTEGNKFVIHQRKQQGN